MSICKNCGRKILEDDLEYIVNDGTPDEYVQCESCHDSKWEDNKIVLCEACGCWFDTDKIHDEGEDFAPCPKCGCDIVDGLTKEEWEEEHCLPRYSVIVKMGQYSRGYVISAKDPRDMMEKLLRHIGLMSGAEIFYSEILLDEDVIE